jgi:hypothetical protein
VGRWHHRDWALSRITLPLAACQWNYHGQAVGRLQMTVEAVTSVGGSHRQV